MGTYVGESKDQMSKKTLGVIREQVRKDAWIALRQYFCGAGNGPEAKVACIVISTLAREHQANNNSRQLDILEKRLQIPEQTGEIQKVVG
jgi:hypothetical protein